MSYVVLSKRNSREGFSLLEILIVLFIFSLLSAFSYRSINFLLHIEKSYAEELKVFSELQKGLLLFGQDANRLFAFEKDSFNLKKRKAISFFVVNSRNNRLKVSYSFKGNSFYREFWDSSGFMKEKPLDSAVLLRGVNDLKFSLVKKEEDVIGIKIFLHTDSTGEVSRIFLVNRHYSKI